MDDDAWHPRLLLLLRRLQLKRAVPTTPGALEQGQLVDELGLLPLSDMEPVGGTAVVLSGHCLDRDTSRYLSSARTGSVDFNLVSGAGHRCQEVEGAVLLDLRNCSRPEGEDQC